MRRLLLPVLTLLLLVAVACGDDSGSTQDEDEPFDSPSTTNGDGRPEDPDPPPLEDLPEGAVVFSPDDVEVDSDGDEVTWTPTAEDIEGVERALQEHIDGHPELEVGDVDEYVRQYVGTGEPLETVSVNALCDPEGYGFDWEDEYITVNDGGACFWQADFSFFTLSLDDFSVNGEA
jgi:hypothetical protein